MSHPTGPQGPTGPRVEASEPEKEQRLAEYALDKLSDGDFQRLVELSYVKDFLQEFGLDVDDDGYIIRMDSGEYATPYTFCRELVRETVQDDGESIADAFFVPETSERVIGRSSGRLHLRDLHTVVSTDDGVAHPVRDDFFNIIEMKRTLGVRYMAVTAWTSVLDSSIYEDSTFVSLGLESDEPLVLRCFNPECEFAGEVEEWDTENRKPMCPNCGGDWTEEIAVCTACQEWHWE